MTRLQRLQQIANAYNLNFETVKGFASNTVEVYGKINFNVVENIAAETSLRLYSNMINNYK